MHTHPKKLGNFLHSLLVLGGERDGLTVHVVELEVANVQDGRHDAEDAVNQFVCNVQHCHGQPQLIIGLRATARAVVRSNTQTRGGETQKVMTFAGEGRMGKRERGGGQQMAAPLSRPSR